MASRIKKSEWIVLYVVTGIIDVFQICIDLFLTELFAAPEVLNEFIDAGIGIGMVIYFPMRGVAVFSHMGRFASMVGMEVLTDMTGGAASLWILEVYYMQKSVQGEEAAQAEEREQEAALAVGLNQQPAYTEVDGIPTRQSSIQRSSIPQKPHNILKGIRPPNGGLRGTA